MGVSLPRLSRGCQTTRPPRIECERAMTTATPVVNGAEGRGPVLRKENPRRGYAVWETKTRENRVRQLPTDPLSCGTQPAYIRLIIVAAATPRPSAPFATGLRQGTKWSDQTKVAA
jgi:hypothetical protein